MSQRTVVAQPDIAMSPLTRSLSARTCAATLASSGPLSTVVFCQSAAKSWCDRTYLGRVLMKAANSASSSCCGQYSDHSR
jgi:hypothetical protein